MMQSEKKVPLGYIPAGSTNDFANSLKIPKDIVKAAHVAVEGRKFPVDVGYFNGDSFIYIAAFGLFTDGVLSDKPGIKECAWTCRLYLRRRETAAQYHFL